MRYMLLSKAIYNFGKIESNQGVKVLLQNTALAHWQTQDLNLPGVKCKVLHVLLLQYLHTWLIVTVLF